MSTLKSRYNLTPQMKYYDQISCEFKPFVMFFNKKNFISIFIICYFKINFSIKPKKTISHYIDDCIVSAHPFF